MDVKVDSLGGSSGVARKLLQNGMNTNVFRPFYDPETKGVYINNAKNDDVIRVQNADYTLLKDEWIQLDRAVNEAYKARRGIRETLERSGLVYNLGTGLRKSKLEYQNMSDVGAASASMDGITRGQNDSVVYDLNSMPLPIVHKDISFTAREIYLSRNEGMPLDTATITAGTNRVLDYIEELFAGTKSYSAMGGTIYGLLNYTGVNTYTLTGNWDQVDSSSVSGETIVADVRGMKQALIDARCFGPYTLFVPTNFETALDEDFKAASDKTIRQRILEVAGISQIVVSDFLTTSKVALVQTTRDVIEVVQAMPVTVMEWETQGGMELNFKIMAMVYPRIRSDYNDRCGIVVGATA